MSRSLIPFLLLLLIFSCREDDDRPNSTGLDEGCRVILEINETVYDDRPPPFNREIDSIQWNYENDRLISKTYRKNGSVSDYIIEYEYTSSFGKLAEIRICGMDTLPCAILERLSYDIENRPSRIGIYNTTASVQGTVDFTYQSNDTFYVDFSGIFNKYRYIFNSSGSIESIEDSLNSANYTNTIYEYDNSPNPYQGNLLEGFNIDFLSANNWKRIYRTRDSLISKDSLINPVRERTIEYNAFNYPIRIEQRSGRISNIIKFEYECR